MTTNVFNNTSYMDISGVCLQRARKQLLVPPPTRLELQATPYNAYTQYQLDMRRKAEIFKYGSSSTHTNGLTKSQKFSQLVNSPQRTYSVQVLEEVLDGTITCPGNHDLVHTLTSSCDVPGPVQTIYLDNTIPLYNYKTGTDPYSQLPVVNERQYITNIETDIIVINSVITELFVLYIDNAILEPTTTFEFSVPFVIGTSGRVPVINDAFVYVYYNNTLMTSNDTKGQYAGGTPPIITDVPNVTYEFYKSDAQTYTGMLNVTNCVMYTTPGFILDIKLLLFMQPPIDFQVIMNPVNGPGLSFS